MVITYLYKVLVYRFACNAKTGLFYVLQNSHARFSFIMRCYDKIIVTFQLAD